MPQIQFFDDTPVKDTSGLGALFGGAASGIADNVKAQQEGDALKQILNAYNDKSQTVEQSIGSLYGDPRLRNADRGNIGNVLKNLDEKRISESKDFKIANFLISNDLRGKSYQEIVKLGMKAGIPRKESMELADKIRMENTQQRLSKSAINKDYNDLINRLKADRKTARRSERDEIDAQMKELENARRRDIKRFLAGDREFTLEKDMSELEDDEIEEAQVEEDVDEEQEEIADQVERITEELTKGFPPSKYKEKEVIDKETGLIFKSDGKQWVPIRVSS